MAAQTTADEVCKYAYEGNLAVLKLKIQGNNSFSSRKDTSGRAPLHWAASGGHTDIVAYLLELQVPVNDRDEISETLIKHGADVDPTDSVGHTPLHRAASKGNLNIVKLLISNKANLDLRDISGCTPLHLACEDDSGEVAKLLIDNGARTDIRNNDKKTAFELAPRTLKRNLESALDR
ncbi:26S proteasome non-ATPase regulatory subunit 10 isoform X2 [Aplysia californica]|uniref:26S proteasome non-ATPase regulatory subunit 10 isoform X2 n=1 Tax=Aplysia californica TaxID=6500 RepID=A0ABM1VVF9_APLCA|nr:26S proteasome non-ATPase regulatory subunit 10 isoform X2 [Aplysia californica]